MQDRLRRQMTNIVEAPLDTFESAEKQIFGTAQNPISLDDSSDEEGSASPEVEVVVKKEPTVPDAGVAEVITVVEELHPPVYVSQFANQVLSDIVHQEGYVTISDVLIPPKDDGWWPDMVKDLNTLFNTNNNVTIFNGTGKSNDNHRQV